MHCLVERKKVSLLQQCTSKISTTTTPKKNPNFDSRELDLHEGIAGNGRDDDARKANDDEEDAVELWGGGGVGLVEHDEPNATQRKHEGRRQALHDVLAVDAVSHERHL